MASNIEIVNGKERRNSMGKKRLVKIGAGAQFFPTEERDFCSFTIVVANKLYLLVSN